MKENQPPFQKKEYEVGPDFSDFPHVFLHILSGDVAVFAGVAIQFDREDKTQKECRSCFLSNTFTCLFSTNTDLKVRKGNVLAAKTSTGFPQTWSLMGIV